MNETLWIAVGLAAQGCFSLRFLWQWIVSERARQSQIPVAFWHFSLMGGSMLLLYAIHRRDVVFIVGQGMGLFIYSRNLWLIYRRRGAGAGSRRSIAENRASSGAYARGLTLDAQLEPDRSPTTRLDTPQETTHQARPHTKLPQPTQSATP